MTKQKTITDELANSLENCLEWMESLRSSGDAGFWDWEENGTYGTAKKVLDEHNNFKKLEEL